MAWRWKFDSRAVRKNPSCSLGALGSTLECVVASVDVDLERTTVKVAVLVWLLVCFF